MNAFIKTSIILNLTLLLGRLSGFIRELFVAKTYGITEEADIVILLLTLPDILTGLLVGGGLSAAIIPALQRAPQNASQILAQFSSWIIIIFLIIAIALACYAQELTGLLAPGLSDDATRTASEMIQWIVFLLPVSVMTGITTAYLHYKNRFLIPGLGTLLFNITLIFGLCIIYITNSSSLGLLIIFVFLGAILRLLSQWFNTELKLKIYTSCFSKKVLDISILKKYTQAMLAGGLLILYPVIVRAYLSHSGEGAIAIFNYASRLVELPLLLAISFLSIVLFPKISAAHQQEPELYNKYIIWGCHAVISISVCITTILLSSEMSYTALIYGMALSPEEVSPITEIFSILILSLPLLSLNQYLVTSYNASEKTFYPMIINLLGCAALLSLVNFSSNINPTFIIKGLVTIYGFNCLMLFMALDKKILFSFTAKPYWPFLIALVVANTITYLILTRLIPRIGSDLVSIVIMMFFGGFTLLSISFFHPSAKYILRRP